MNKLKPEDIVWGWDWLVDAPTALCPDCYETDGGHSGACGCIRQSKGSSLDDQSCIKSGFWEATKEAVDLGLAPNHPTITQILDHIENIKKYTQKKSVPYEKLHGFNPPFEESEYLKIKNNANFHNLSIPTFEKIGEEADIWLYYNCKAAKEWYDDSPEIEIIDPSGFPNGLDSDERISWHMYYNYRHNSKTIKHERISKEFDSKKYEKEK